MRFLKGNQDTSRAPNNNKQPCSCQTSLRDLLFHLVQRISLHFKSTDLYLFCTTTVFPKFLLPFQSQASFQSEQFGSYDYAAPSLSLLACSLSSQRSRMLMQKRPLFSATRVTRLDRSPFFDCRVTLLAGPTFLHMNTLARPAGSTWSKRDNQSIRDRCFRQSEDARTLLARAKGSTLFSYHCTLMEERPFSQGQLFLT